MIGTSKSVSRASSGLFAGFSMWLTPFHMFFLSKKEYRTGRLPCPSQLYRTLRSTRRSRLILRLIDPEFKFLRRAKHDDLSRRDRSFFPGLGVTANTFLLVAHRESGKAAYLDGFTLHQAIRDFVQQTIQVSDTFVL